MLQRQIHYSISFVINVCLVCFSKSSTYNDNVCPFVILPLTVCMHISIYLVLWGCFHVSITGIKSPCPALVSCHVLWLRRPGCLLKVGCSRRRNARSWFANLQCAIKEPAAPPDGVLITACRVFFVWFFLFIFKDANNHIMPRYHIMWYFFLINILRMPFEPEFNPLNLLQNSPNLSDRLKAPAHHHCTCKWVTLFAPVSEVSQKQETQASL